MDIFCPCNLSVEKIKTGTFCHHQLAGPGSKGSRLPLCLASRLESFIESLLHVRPRGGAWKDKTGTSVSTTQVNGDGCHRCLCEKLQPAPACLCGAPSGAVTGQKEGQGHLKSCLPSRRAFLPEIQGQIQVSGQNLNLRKLIERGVI